VRIAFEELDPRILPDMGVKVAFQEETAGDAERPRRLLVPGSAVRRDGSREVAYVVRGGRAERRAIRSGSTRGEDTEVVSGLSPGERVVVQGPDSLKDGERVQEIE
jgi:multidrug efflux pump subunit AcrA (membrane-fusion protein)